MIRTYRPEYIIAENGCWIWQKALDGSGYGVVRAGAGNMRAHRYVYEKYFGKIPDGMTLDHTCRVKSCVCPNHLEAVTRAENLRRMMRFRAAKKDVTTDYERWLQSRRSKG